jgi:L-fuconolactonase
MVIDAHHHFWHHTTEEFGWIPDEMAAIRKDFAPDDLAPLLRAHHIDGVISVQARQTEVETRWLLDLGKNNAMVRGTVGWVNLRSPDINDHLSDLACDGLVGVRHVLQGEPDAFMEDADFNRGLAALPDEGLTYDLLVVEHQLPAAIALVDRHPRLRFILDHFGKPRIDLDQLEPWKTHLRELSNRPNVWCKISGGITEAALDWTPDRLVPYLDASLEAFGAGRLIFGSNWPVCETAGGYGVWFEAVKGWSSSLSRSEQEGVFGHNAVDFYKLK